MKKNNIKAENAASAAQVISLISIIVIGILLMLNSVSYKSLSYSPGGQSDETVSGLSIYETHIALPKGEYTVTAAGRGTVSLRTVDDTVLGEGTAGGTFKIDVPKDETDVLICGEESGSVNSLDIKSSGMIFKDLTFIMLLFEIGALLMWYFKFIKGADFSNAFVYFVLGLAVLAASAPLLTFYVQYGNDLNFHLWRIEGIKDGLLSGQFPVRVDPSINNGYGYITSVMYPELFLYIPAILRIFGISAVTSYKTLLVLMNAATAFIMYRSAYGITRSKFTAMLASVIYTLSAWRLYNTYYRAALGESLALVFFPLVVYGLYEIFKGNKRNWWVLAVGFTCVIQSHFISSMFIAGLSLFCLIVFFKDIKENGRWIELLKAAVLVILLNAWFIVPFISTYMNLDMNIQNKPTNVEFFRNAIIPAQLFNIFDSTFGRSQLTPDGINGDLSLSPGLGAIICFFVAVYYFMFEKKRKINAHGFNLAVFIFAAILLFMSTTLFPWELLQKPKLINTIIGTIQFPWRMLGLAAAIITIVGAAVISAFTNREHENAAIAAALVICFVSCVPYFTSYTTGQGTSLTKGYTPSTDGAPGWDEEYFLTGTRTSELEPGKYTVSGSANITSYEKSGTNITLEVSGARGGSYVEVPLLYYPGYVAKDNNSDKLDVSAGENNVLRVMLNNGTSTVKIKYSSPIKFRVGDIITFITLLGCGYVIYCKKKGKELKFI